MHLSDLNSAKRGIMDKRCLLEARPAGKKPVSTDHEDVTVEKAVKGAAGKMKRLLQTAFSREAHGTSRASLQAGKRTLSATGTLQKLGRIEATLTELFDSSTTESPQFERHVRAATEALHKARMLIQTNGEGEAKPQKLARLGPKKAAAKAAASGRTPKRKGIFQARRKSWPQR